uniref:Uncharacterized protein n=1 Tax=Glossina brevipalpis TaxID=37001 RepID=A0A1A9WRJ4_9MUSC
MRFISHSNSVKFAVLCRWCADYSEQDIYNNSTPKNLTKFKPLPNFCQVTEIMRFNKYDLVSNNRINLHMNFSSLSSTTTKSMSNKRISTETINATTPTATKQLQNIENCSLRTREPLNNLIITSNENYSTQHFSGMSVRNFPATQ